MAERLDREKELWTLANVVTAFAIAQTLAFCYALGDKLNLLLGLELGWRIFIAAACLGFGCAYGYAVARCQSLIGESDNRDLWRETTRWRFAAIAIFSIIAATVVILVPPSKPNSSCPCGNCPKTTDVSPANNR